MAGSVRQRFLTQIDSWQMNAQVEYKIRPDHMRHNVRAAGAEKSVKMSDGSFLRTTHDMS